MAAAGGDECAPIQIDDHNYYYVSLYLNYVFNYETADLQFAVMSLFLLKILYLYPRIGVFVEIAYLRIRYVSYPIPVSVSARLYLRERMSRHPPGCRKVALVLTTQGIYHSYRST
jgi:hypothetical protein